MSEGDHEGTVDDAGIRRFNESFYASDPADYLLTRLQLLLLAGGRRAELRQIFESGVEYAGITFGPREAEGAPDVDASSGAHAEDADVEDEQSLDKFVVIESQQLLHHACETAIRMFFVHAAESAVPWIALAGDRSFSQFKERVRIELVDSTPDVEVLGHLCLGSKAPPIGTDQDEWPEPWKA